MYHRKRQGLSIKTTEEILSQQQQKNWFYAGSNPALRKRMVNADLKVKIQYLLPYGGDLKGESLCLTF